MNYKDNPVYKKYQEWHENNIIGIRKKQWSLADETLLQSPETDTCVGLNLIHYPEIKGFDIQMLLDEIEGTFRDAIYIYPLENLHITLLDIIPHNSGIDVMQISANDYAEILESVFQKHSPMKVNFYGILVSPDGVTLKGVPQQPNLLDAFRNDLRDALIASNLLFDEKAKYTISTTHIALAKFIRPPEGNEILNFVDKRLEVSYGNCMIDSAVLNISGRYDKTKNVELIKKYNFSNSK